MNDRVFIQPQALVESKNVGPRTRIWAFAHVLEGARLGCDCNICDFVFIENDVIIGDEVTIKSGVYIWDGVRIEDRVFVGPNVTFTNDIYPRSKAHLDSHPKTVIREGASLGANSVLVAGIVVGRYAMIGVGSVVTKNVGDFELLYGNPARRRGYVCKCSRKLDFDGGEVVTCYCNSRFRLVDGQVRQV